ncbi:MAG TPA: NAD(P)/FAD-dependent oxidoreductase [Steroidobacteraceae bacterium]|nr:NAD(P)/FAD-dependent oxidoreductase [Steroidobacteraceae bacterium]
MRIGIIGGGLMGLALAEQLGSAGHRVTVYERAAQPGGLATWHDFGDFTWDRFYHVILPSDTALVDFIRRIGLGGKLRWQATRTGFYVDRATHSLSSGLDFLKFPLLGPWSKFRLAATILYCSRIRDWRRLEGMTVEEFLVRYSGRATFEKFWRPLLLAKLGENYTRVSAVFIWTYVKRLFSARDAAAQTESLGYVSGGYRTVFARLVERIRAAGGDLRLEVEVGAVRPLSGGGVEIEAGGAAESFDKVIFTGPVNVLRAVADPSLVQVPAQGDIEYLGVLCLALVTRRPFCPYYVLNIADERIPFTGIIGMSSLVDTAETAGLHLTYLPKYVLSDDAALRRPDAEVVAEFMAGFRRMFPGFPETEIAGVHLNRAVKVQPLQVIGYSDRVQQPRTRNADFYVVNTAQFASNTLNNNEVIRSVNAFLEQFEPEFRSAA